MATLYVPPTEFVTENPEAASRLRASAERFVNQKLAELGLAELGLAVPGSGATPRRTESRGVFRGLREFEWKGPRDAILGTVFLLPGGKSQGEEFARLATFVWRDDCLLAGASWERGAAPLAGAPAEVERGGEPLARQSARAQSGRSPLRWESRASGPLANRLSLFLEAVAGERLAAQGHVVNASLSRLACKWMPPLAAPQAEGAGSASVAPASERGARAAARDAASAPTQAWPAIVPTPAPRKPEFPRRPHRVVRSELAFSGRADAWPSVVANVFVTDGVFGGKKETVLGADPKGKATPFRPVSLADAALRGLEPLVHDVRQASFAIVRRRGRWAYLDRGRAYGLEIGTHLVGPGQAKLHIIQFAPDEKGVDVGIALVRDEDPAAPLKEGDTLTFDGTEFPLRAAPALETNPL